MALPSEMTDLTKNRGPFFRAAGTLLAGIAVSALITACGETTAAPAPSPPPTVRVAHPSQRTITDWDEHTGRLAAIETVEVRPRVTGFVQRVHFEEGSMVRAGALLVTLDPRTFRATLAEVEARRQQAEVRLELAKSELVRIEALIDTRAVSREELDQRRQEMRTAEAALAAAEAEVEAAALDLEFTRVVAPISGRVGRAQVTEGNLVTGGSGTGTVLTTLVSLDPIYLYFTPDERAAQRYLRQAREVGPKGEVPVEMQIGDETGYPHRGRLDFLDNRVDEATGTLLVRAVFDNPDRLLLPGMFGRVRLRNGSPGPGLVIPEKAIGQDQTQQFVLVVGEADTVERRVIHTGPVFEGGLRVVREGLSADDRVVVEGLQSARPGTVVTPEPAALATEPGTEPAR